MDRILVWLWRHGRALRLWGAWLLLSCLTVAGMGAGLMHRPSGATSGAGPALLSPGPLTSGHHLLGNRCDLCHGTPFAGRAAIEAACVRCHGADLKEAGDFHPIKKFRDPSNAAMRARLDGARCTTCHTEHRPALAGPAGETLERGFCWTCHDDVGTERPTHAGLDAETCVRSGCHNYHDNGALYEDFLVRHGDDPDHLARALLPRVTPRPPEGPALAASEADGTGEAASVADWAATAHAAAGVNCTGCHGGDGERRWDPRPGEAACGRCHDGERAGFHKGRHGMASDAGTTLDLADARLPLKEDARIPTCVACHEAHRFDVAEAAVDACMACHDDRHSLAYGGSPHQRLWNKERQGLAPAGSGVSCGACHLPRQVYRLGGEDRVRVQHNQSAGLRPVTKMAREVCMGCHGLRFTLDALADAVLLGNNFTGRPSAHVDSIDMAMRAAGLAERRGAGPAPERDSP